MERENKNPDRERYLQQLRDLDKSLEQRVQQEEMSVAFVMFQNELPSDLTHMVTSMLPCALCTL